MQKQAQFNYSTGATHLISAVLEEVVPSGTCEYAHRVLFDPLGIDIEHWGRDPMGVYSGGCNLYMTARELALFGFLYLRDGMLNGRRIVPRTWIESTLVERVRVDDEYGYGSLWWTTELGGHEVWLAWGFGGQMIYLVRDLDLMVVTTTDTRGFVHDGDFHAPVGSCVIPTIEARYRRENRRR